MCVSRGQDVKASQIYIICFRRGVFLFYPKVMYFLLLNLSIDAFVLWYSYKKSQQRHRSAIKSITSSMENTQAYTRIHCIKA